MPVPDLGPAYLNLRLFLHREPRGGTDEGCSTLAVYDRKRNRLGTIYLGEMPEERQTTMTERLTKVIHGVLDDDASKSLRLR